jgi:hypothetical protein
MDRADLPARVGFRSDLNDACGRHFGQSDWSEVLGTSDVEGFLDLVEIAVELGPKTYRGEHVFLGGYMAAVSPEIETEVNDLFDRHRFGYRLDDGMARQIGSPLLSVEVVGPALLALNKAGWTNAELCSTKEASTNRTTHLRLRTRRSRLL